MTVGVALNASDAPNQVDATVELALEVSEFGSRCGDTPLPRRRRHRGGVLGHRDRGTSRPPAHLATPRRTGRLIPPADSTTPRIPCPKAPRHKGDSP